MRSPAMIFGPSPRVTIPAELADEATLLAHLGLTQAELKKIWWFRHRMYHEIEIVKRSGKVRKISAPDTRLKGLQRKIAASLNSIYSIRNPVHGFVIGKSVKTNAESHVRGKYLLNIDLKEFFPSITEKRVEGLLNSLGINKRTSEILTRICCNNGKLPQGAPSSPVISNLICFKMDKALLTVAKEARCIFTRYADDISFSGYKPLSGLFETALPPAGKFSPELLSKDLKQVIESNGFEINAEKAHYADRNTRRTVTGIKINEGLNVDRRFVRNLRAEIFSCKQLGVVAAQAKYCAKYGGSGSIANHIRGKLAWLGHIKGQTDPVFRRLVLDYNKEFPKQKIMLLPTITEVRERAVWVLENDTDIDQGSAFFLEGVGLITSAHCVGTATTLWVYHPKNPANRHSVSVSKTCKTRDIALLSHLIPESAYLELKATKDPLSITDQVAALGYPQFANGDRLNTRVGAVTSLPVRSTVKMIEVSQSIENGMSGGPLLDSQGQVIGVNYWGGEGQARNFCILVDELIQFLK